MTTFKRYYKDIYGSQKKYLYGKKKSIIFPTYGFINLYLALHKCVTKRGKRLEM